MIALLLGTVLSAENCAKKNTVATTTASETKGSISDTKWALQTINGKPFQLAEGIDNPWIFVDAKNSAVKGFGGCNQLMGTAKLDGDAISFPGLAGTKMMCAAVQDVENRYLEALRSTNTFKLEGANLRFYNKDKEVATFVPGK